MTPTTPASAVKRRDPKPAPPARRERVKAQDLTAAQVRAWLDDACMDVVESDDERDVAFRLDDTRMHVRTTPRRGELYIMGDFSCASVDADRADWLEAINTAHRGAMFVRCVLRGPIDEPYLRIEHEHFSCDGYVTRRQFIKLVRMVKCRARELHVQILDEVRGG
jgi:hypothetical protein